jgi:hypothetical protein
MAFASGCDPGSLALPCSARIRRTRSDRNNWSGDNSAISRSPLSRRQIDDIRVDAENFPGRIDNHTDHAIAQRHHYDLAALLALAGDRQSQQRMQRHDRQQAVAQRHDAQHRGFRTRQLRNMIRQRNDLTHPVQRQRIFLLAEEEAQERNQRLGRCRCRRTSHRDRRSAGCMACGDAELGELPGEKTRGAQYLDRVLAFGALDHAIQQRRIDRTRSGIVLFKPIGGKRHQTFDPIDDKADPGIAAHHDHTGLLAGVMRRQMQQSPQADNRQDNAAQIGKPEQARGHQRHMRQTGQPDDFRDGAKPQPERFAGDPENQEFLGRDILICRDMIAGRCGKIGLLFPNLLTSASHCGAG